MCAKSYLLHQFSSPHSLLLLINDWTSQWRWLWCNCAHLMSSCWTSHSQPVLRCPFLTIAWHINFTFMSSWSTQCCECLWPNLIFFLLVFSKCSCLFQAFYPIFIFSFISYLLSLIPSSKESQMGCLPLGCMSCIATAGLRARGTEERLQSWTMELLPQKVAHTALWGVFPRKGEEKWEE